MIHNTLEVSNLNTSFFTEQGEVKVLRDVSIVVGEGQVVGIVGESGCGKSMLARSIMGLVRKPGKITSGSILLDGKELTTLSKKELCAIRGKEMSMGFQEPMTSLNPTMRIGKQVQEVIAIHDDLGKQEARLRALEILSTVGIPEVEARYNAYPHELSGGMRQRVMIAMAMVLHPRLLIADEPTTALDATVETQIIDLLKRLTNVGTSVLIISHNLGVIAQVADFL
jgi:ABC-type dipeptide/oligopeptide/nickel transport system ATPase component